MKLWRWRHEHIWRDVERTIEMHPRLAVYGEIWVKTTQWIIQWCEACGRYRQFKMKGASQSGPAPLRSPVPSVFLDEETK